MTVYLNSLQNLLIFGWTPLVFPVLQLFEAGGGGVPKHIKLNLVKYLPNLVILF